MIFEGYVKVKLWKVGLCFNIIDLNVCYCMVFVVVVFMCIFGMDELMGCYNDIEKIDVFVFWGFNMVEMYFILWSCIFDCCLFNDNVCVVVMFIFEYCLFELVDILIIFKLYLDLVIFNYIVNYII